MIKTLTEYEFCREWETNEERKYQFSHGAQKALYEYLNDYEESTGTPVELDTVALCCEYSEYSSALDAAKNYGDFIPCEQDDKTDEITALIWLEEQTTVIPFDYTIKLSDGTILGDKGIIIAQF